jgi:2-methylisocitrate lyase-like PEP mutase family enzyme
MERLVAYAGADGPFAPEVEDLNVIEATVFAVASKPGNVLLLAPSMNVADLAAADVRRLRVGFSCAAAAWVGGDEAALSGHDDGHLPAAKGVNHGKTAASETT